MDANAVLLDLIRQEKIQINSPADLMKYIRRAINNEVRDEFKLLTRKRRDIRRNENVPADEQNLYLNRSSPSQIMIRNEIFDRIIRCLGVGGNELLRLVLEGHSWEAIGKTMRCKPDAIRMRWNRAVKTIQLQMLEGDSVA